MGRPALETSPRRSRIAAPLENGVICKYSAQYHSFNRTRCAINSGQRPTRPFAKKCDRSHLQGHVLMQVPVASSARVTCKKNSRRHPSTSSRAKSHRSFRLRLAYISSKGMCLSRQPYMKHQNRNFAWLVAHSRTRKRRICTTFFMHRTESNCLGLTCIVQAGVTLPNFVYINVKKYLVHARLLRCVTSSGLISGVRKAHCDKLESSCG